MSCLELVGTEILRGLVNIIVIVLGTLFTLHKIEKYKVSESQKNENIKAHKNINSKYLEKCIELCTDILSTQLIPLDNVTQQAIYDLEEKCMDVERKFNKVMVFYSIVYRVYGDQELYEDLQKLDEAIDLKEIDEKYSNKEKAFYEMLLADYYSMRRDTHRILNSMLQRLENHSKS